MDIRIYQVIRYSLVAIRMCSYLRVHVYVYEVNSYEGSSSKWYLLRGASVHPGMAMVEL